MVFQLQAFLNTAQNQKRHLSHKTFKRLLKTVFSRKISFIFKGLEKLIPIWSFFGNRILVQSWYRLQVWCVERSFDIRNYWSHWYQVQANRFLVFKNMLFHMIFRNGNDLLNPKLKLDFWVLPSWNLETIDVFVYHRCHLFDNQYAQMDLSGTVVLSMFQLFEIYRTELVNLIVWLKYSWEIYLRVWILSLWDVALTSD